MGEGKREENLRDTSLRVISEVQEKHWWLRKGCSSENDMCLDSGIILMVELIDCDGFTQAFWSLEISVCVCVRVCVYMHAHALSCPTLCNPLDCSLSGSFVHGIFQARILEEVAISSSRGSLWPRDWTHVSNISCVWQAGSLPLYHQGRGQYLPISLYQ